MEVLVLNTSFEVIYLLDSFESLIWTDRFNKYGDFEIYLPASKKMLEILKPDYYLFNKDSEHLMIIEDIRLQSDSEDGNHLTVSGRSLESIIGRRIIWDQTNLSGNFQNGIKTLINDAIINPSDESRKISNFLFVDSEDEDITSLELEAQYTGENLYNIVSENSIDKNIGFKIVLDDQNRFVFSFYTGEDRSFNQIENPFVVFSPNFENIINSDYKDIRTEYCNVTLVAGEGEGTERTTTVVGTETGLTRREIFTDARDLSSNTDEGTLTPEQYEEKLQQRGKENLKEYKIDQTFEGEVDTTQMFLYKRDFFMGDIVELENEYGMQSRSRIVEIIFSQDEEGYSVYPTFEIVDEEEEGGDNS